MESNDNKNKNKKKGLPIHFIPFGRIRVDRDISGNRSSVLVGREKQRAFLIDALTGTPKRGAYLVTGRRGVGKTTFVQNCLNEFKANVFRRHLRSRVGRAPLDLLFTIIVISSWVVLSLTASDLIEFVAPLVSSNVLLLIPLCAALLITALPFLYGAYVLWQLATAISRRWSVVMACIFIILAAGTSIFIFPFGSPAYSMMLSMFGFAVFVLVSPLFGARSAPLAPVAKCTTTKELQKNYLCRILLCVSVFFGPLVITFFFIYAIDAYITQTLVLGKFFSILELEGSDSMVSPESMLAEITKKVAVVLPLIIFLSCGVTGAVYFLSLSIDKTRIWRGTDAAHLTKSQAFKAFKRFILFCTICIALIILVCFSDFFIFWTSSYQSEFIGREAPVVVASCVIAFSVIIGTLLGLFVVAPREAFLNKKCILFSYVIFTISLLSLIIFWEEPRKFTSLLDLLLICVVLLSGAPLWGLFIEKFLTETVYSSESKSEGAKYSAHSFNGSESNGSYKGKARISKKFKSRRLVPPIEGLLFLKGLLFIAIGLQLSYPVLVIGPEAFKPTSAPNHSEILERYIEHNISVKSEFSDTGSSDTGSSGAIVNSGV